MKVIKMQGNVQHAISRGFCRDPGEWIRPSGPGQELGQGIGAGNCCRVFNNAMEAFSCCTCHGSRAQCLLQV